MKHLHMSVKETTREMRWCQNYCSAMSVAWASNSLVGKPQNWIVLFWEYNTLSTAVSTLYPILSPTSLKSWSIPFKLYTCFRLYVFSHFTRFYVISRKETPADTWYTTGVSHLGLYRILSLSASLSIKTVFWHYWIAHEWNQDKICDQNDMSFVKFHTFSFLFDCAVNRCSNWWHTSSNRGTQPTKTFFNKLRWHTSKWT